MPQMSPMNWMVISMMFMSSYNLIKMYVNMNFKSSMNHKIKIYNKNINLSW